MTNYYNDLKTAIRNSEAEIDRLQQRLVDLTERSQETPQEDDQFYYDQILEQISNEQEKLKENRTTLERYNTAAENIILLRKLREETFTSPEIPKLRELLATETDPTIRHQIEDEIEEKEKIDIERRKILQSFVADRVPFYEQQVRENIALLSDDLARELRNSIIDGVNLSNNNVPSISKKENNQDPHQNYNVALESIQKLRRLRNETIKEGSDDEKKAFIEDLEIRIKNQEELVQQNLSKLTEPEKQELRNYFVNEVSQSQKEEEIVDERQLNMKKGISEANEELIAAERRLAESIKRFNQIFAEERTIREQEGPFATEQALDEFTDNFMQRKIKENEIFEQAKRDIKEAERKKKSREKKLQEYAILVERANQLLLSVESFDKIRKVVEDKQVMAAIYAKKGLGEINKRTKDGKEQYRQVSDSAIKEVISQLKKDEIIVNSNGTNYFSNETETNKEAIIDSINIIYGTDIATQSKDPRRLKMSEDKKNAVVENQGIQVNIKKVPRNGSIPNKAPGKAPIGVPVITDDKLANNSDNFSDLRQIFPEVKPFSDPVPRTLGLPAGALKPQLPAATNQTKRPDFSSLRSVFPEISPFPAVKQRTIDTTLTMNNEELSNKITDTAYMAAIYERIRSALDSIEITAADQKPTIPNLQATENHPAEAAPKRELSAIITELTAGLKAAPSTEEHLQPSNIKAMRSFQEELSSEDTRYNIVRLVPPIVKVPTTFLEETAQASSSPTAKVAVETIKERLDNLSEQDLMTIYQEYDGALEANFPTVLTSVIGKKMTSFSLEKAKEINDQLEEQYKNIHEVIGQVDELDEKLQDSTLSESSKKQLEDEKTTLLSGQAKKVATIRREQSEANSWLAGGTKFSNSIINSAQNLSIVGYHFIEEASLDKETYHKLFQLSLTEMQAIGANDDETALRAFIEYEDILKAASSKNSDKNNQMNAMLTDTVRVNNPTDSKTLIKS